MFKFSQIEKLLYTTVSVANTNILQPKETSLLLSWNMDGILSSLVDPRPSDTEEQELEEGEEPKAVPREDLPIPLNISNLQLFGQSPGEPVSSNCLINFNPLVLKSYYNVKQFQFFYSDEKITSSALFADRESPSQLIGTNYGRVFVVPLFQELENKF